jgi:hypothetical protein
MEVLHWYTNLHVLQGASGSSPADAITCSNILRHCQHRYLFDLVLRALMSNLNSAYYYIIWNYELLLTFSQPSTPRQTKHNHTTNQHGDVRRKEPDPAEYETSVISG